MSLMSAIELTTSQWVVKARVFLRHKMDKVTEDELSDTVLYRNLYTNILSQQINAENRLFHLMTAREGQNDTFDKHLAEVRARVEKDRRRIQKLGERLVLIERKEMQIILKDRKTTPSAKERQSNIVSSLLNKEKLCDHFKFGQNNTQNEQTNDNTLKSATSNQTAKFAQAVVDPNEITVCFKNADSQNAPKDSPNTPALSTKPVDKQGHSKKLESLRNVPWFACQDLKGVLPKRVSFNDIPDVIASQEVGNERFLANHEAGWNSHCSENDAGNSTKRYNEPPPEFSHYSYHDGNRQNRQLQASSKTLSHNPENANRCEDEGWGETSDLGNSPFKSPWEGVVSTSLQRKRNDSTQVAPSSSANNEVCSDELSGNTGEDTKTPATPTQDLVTNIEKSSENTTNTANVFKMEPQEHKKFQEWLNLRRNSDSKEETKDKPYEYVDKSKRDPNFIRDDALMEMRRQSWSSDPPRTNKKQQKTRGKFSSIFRAGKNSRASQVIKADKKEFTMTKKIRKRMSLRPLPETPDGDTEKNESALQCDTADSLDTFH